MIDVDLDFIIKGIENQGATCTIKPRNASLRFKNNDLTHYWEGYFICSQYRS